MVRNLEYVKLKYRTETLINNLLLNDIRPPNYWQYDVTGSLSITNMELKEIVCTLEQAQKLKELGIHQYAFHHWLIGEPAVERGWMISRTACYAPPLDEWEPSFAAFTLSELGQMLPSFFPSFVHDGYNHAHCRNERVDTFPLLSGETEYDTTPAHILNKELIPIQTGETEVEAKANMLIFLIENGFLNVADLNSRVCPEGCR